MMKDEEVNKYVAKQKSPQREICVRLREIILATLPKVHEKMKLGVPWYEGKFYLVGLKDSVNLGFCIEGLSVDEQAEFKGKGKMMRHLKFKSVDEIDQNKVKRLLKLVDKKAKTSCEMS